MVKLADKNLCTGCGACYNACKFGSIQMYQDKYGFYYPTIDSSKCKDCNICTKSCPIISYEIPKNDLLNLYAAYSKDSDIRKDSTSGGIFSELAKTILNDGGIVLCSNVGSRGPNSHQKRIMKRCFKYNDINVLNSDNLEDDKIGYCYTRRKIKRLF